MPYALTLRGEPLPLAPGTTIQPNLVGPDLADLTTIPSAYSNELSIPYTPEVAARLGFAAHPQAVTTFPYDAPGYAEATYDGVPLLQGAVLSIAGIDGRTLSARLFQGAVNLFEQLGEKSIRELSLGSLRWDIFQYARNTPQGPTVPIPPIPPPAYVATVELRPNDVGNQIPITEQIYPAVRVAAVFAAILSEAGWSATGWPFARKAS